MNLNKKRKTFKTIGLFSLIVPLIVYWSKYFYKTSGLFGKS